MSSASVASARSVTPSLAMTRLRSEMKLFNFGVSARELSRLNPDSSDKAEMRSAFAEFGGQTGLAQKLCSDPARGISADEEDLSQRREA